ncbi:FecR family protein [Sphingobacterium bovistauri]|uniref:DUF4974 domain-containing protein n=1 Tax=Sphingobacterium bovistauri TaxID=2781959 RepID=A0ABS7Z3A9_9SPHI|nr:FecR domain-containing protein [Sphingobacterium bovistauri]MCA5004656.1 DUF4974 domain-containing protein [Sphingobacterium bovistauri]
MNKLNSVEDFLIQNSFQQYCNGSDSRSVAYWEKFILQNPQYKSEIEEARKMYFILNGNKRPINIAVETMDSRMNEENIQSTRSYFWLKNIAAIALVTVFSVFIYNYFQTKESANTLANILHNNPKQIFATKYGEKRSVVLEDGTKVILNAGSVLTVGNNFNGKNREVVLDGEAYFEVTHNNFPFTVFTENFNVKVLGTTFNVKSYKNDNISCASLLEGQIALELVNRKNDIITIKPGEKLYLKKKEQLTTDAVLNNPAELEEITLSKNVVLDDKITIENAWTENRLEIHNEQFSDLAHTLERWYDVKIDFQDHAIASYKYSGTFVDESIEEVLQALQTAKSFNYKIDDKKIIITN